MFKKLWMALSIFSVFLVLVGCSEWSDDTADENQEENQEEDQDENPYESSPESETVSFENLAEEYDVEDKDFDLHFYEDGVPYVGIEAFVENLDGAVMTDEIETEREDGVFHMTYTLEAEDSDEAGEGGEDIYEDTTLEFELDTEENTVTVNRLAFFNGMSEETETDFGENLEVSDYEETDGDPVTIDLSDYDITATEEDGDVRLPLNIANLFFSGSMYDVYYNGDSLYGVDTYQLSDDPEISDTLNDSSKNDESIPDALKAHTLDYLALSFDYFYGLKSMNDVDAYYDDLETIEEDLEGSDTEHYRAIFDYAFSHDDIHTSPLLSGYYEEDLSFQASLDDFGPRTSTYYEAYYNETLSAHCEAGNDLSYSEDGTKARIKIDGFDEDSLETFESYMDEIDSEGGVDDVVLDLSCNGGGVIGTMIQMLGYMTDDPIDYYSKNATDGSTSKTTYDVDIDARDYDFHLLTSPLTFSAANSMASIAQDNGIASILGEGTSGGASSIMTNITPSGSILIMSSPEIMSDDDYESIESGIEPDVEIPLENIPDSETVFDDLP